MTPTDRDRERAARVMAEIMRRTRRQERIEEIGLKGAMPATMTTDEFKDMLAAEFAAVRAEQREADAKLCEAVASKANEDGDIHIRRGADYCAAAIREER